MTGLPLILDSAALSGLSQSRPPAHLRALLQAASERGREVVAPTVICAEVARGRDRTRALEAAVIHDDRPGGSRPAIRLIDTDFVLARQVGAILHAAGRGSADLVDAHVVAVAVAGGGGLVATSDPDDILALAATVPATRVQVTRV